MSIRKSTFRYETLVLAIFFILTLVIVATY
jgi:hypothetical protein